MLPLSLFYDHRAIDGADGARFCAALAAALPTCPAYSSRAVSLERSPAGHRNFTDVLVIECW